MPQIEASLPPSNPAPAPATNSSPTKPKKHFAPALQQAAQQTAAPKKSSRPAQPTAAKPAATTKATGKGAAAKTQTAPSSNSPKTVRPGQSQESDAEDQLPDLTQEEAESQQKGADKQPKDTSKHTAKDAQTADGSSAVQVGPQAQIANPKDTAGELKPHTKTATTALPATAGSDQDQTPSTTDAPATASPLAEAVLPDPAAVLAAQIGQVHPPVAPVAEAPSTTPAAPPPLTDASFAAANQPQIVQSIHGQLMPNGGNMQIHLSPPELGDMQVSVQVRDGAISAAFETSNEQATRLVSHSLGQLKSALEGAGVSVEKLQVSQTPRSSSSQSGEGNSQDQQRSATDQQSQRDQQRRELLRRMWQKVAGDPLDLVA